MRIQELQDFLGQWRIRRNINHNNGQSARLTGQATFEPLAGGMRYVETGDLALQEGPTVSARQEYFWRPDLSVYFPDGRFFHQIPRPGGTTAHWCPPDQYDGAYDFSHWPDWTLRWRVKGPNKDYISMTHYSR